MRGHLPPVVLILHQAWVKMENMLVGGASTPFSADMNFDDGAISQQNANSSRVWCYSCIVSDDIDFVL